MLSYHSPTALYRVVAFCRFVFVLKKLVTAFAHSCVQLLVPFEEGSQAKFLQGNVSAAEEAYLEPSLDSQSTIKADMQVLNLEPRKRQQEHRPWERL